MRHAAQPQAWRHEVHALVSVALPLILASLVSMGMSITDVLMISRIGPVAMAASAAISDYYSICYYFLSGIVAAIAPLISQARGDSDTGAIRLIVSDGLMLTVILTIPGSLVVYGSDMALALIGLPESVIAVTHPYAKTMAVTFVFMMFVNLIQQYLAAQHRTQVIFAAAVIALPINAIADYLLIFGKLGFPALGLAGAGIASAVSAVVILSILLVSAEQSEDFRQKCVESVTTVTRSARIRTILRTGLPIGIANMGIMGVFLLTTVLIGVFGEETLVAHTIALRVAGLVFAIPVGFAQAAAVRIGYAVGARDLKSLYLTMRCALILSVAIGLMIMIIILLFSGGIAGLFTGATTPVAVDHLAIVLLSLMAIGQPFNNLGFVGAGVLRGFNDTRIPMYLSVASFWFVAFFGGWTVVKLADFGGTAIWSALLVGEVCYGVLIAVRLVDWFSIRRLRGKLRPLSLLQYSVS